MELLLNLWLFIVHSCPLITSKDITILLNFSSSLEILFIIHYNVLVY